MLIGRSVFISYGFWWIGKHIQNEIISVRATTLVLPCYFPRNQMKYSIPDSGVNSETRHHSHHSAWALEILMQYIKKSKECRRWWWFDDTFALPISAKDIMFDMIFIAHQDHPPFRLPSRQNTHRMKPYRRLFRRFVPSIRASCQTASLLIYEAVVWCNKNQILNECDLMCSDARVCVCVSTVKKSLACSMWCPKSMTKACSSSSRSKKRTKICLLH